MPKDSILVDQYEFEREEAQARFEAALKGAMKGPHKPIENKSSKEAKAEEPKKRKKKSV